MQGELSELDLQSVVLLKFLDTPGDEVAPGSNEIGKDFEYEWFGHDFLQFLILLVPLVPVVQTFKSLSKSNDENILAAPLATFYATGFRTGIFPQQMARNRPFVAFTGLAFLPGVGQRSD